jgi:diaminopropionate ammonia-lyase
MADGLASWLASPAAVIVVEPEGAACVAAALAQDRPVRVPGELETAAEMLACGEASAPALAALQRHGARAMTVPESALGEATRLLRELGGPATTASGAAGLAALMRLMPRGATPGFGLDASSRVLILVTEADLDSVPRPPCTHRAPIDRQD